MIDLGDVVPLSVLVTDNSTGNPADAGAVTLTLTLPDGTIVTPAVVHAGTGSYTSAYTPVQAGRHEVRWVATGAFANAYTDVFQVAPADPALLISLAEARTAIGLPAANTSKDEDLRTYLAAATPIIEDIIGPVLPLACDEWHDGGARVLQLLHAPVIAVTSVTESYGAGNNRILTAQPLDGSSFDSYGYTVDLELGTVIRRVSGVAGRFVDGRSNVHVVYTAGRTAGRTVLRGNYLLATRRLVKHLWQQEQQGDRPDLGTPDNPVSYTPSGYAVPKAVIELCGPDARIPGIG